MSVHIRHGARRAVFLAGSALIVALGTNACGGPKPGGQTVAVVDGEPVTQAELDVDRTVDQSTGDQSSRNIALQSLINRKLFVAAAKEQKLDKDPNFRLQADRQEEILLARKYLEQVTAGVSSMISEADINNYLAQHPQYGEGRKIVNINQIQFTMPTDKGIIAKLQNARSLGEIAQLLQQNGVTNKPTNISLDSAILPHQMFDGLVKSLSGEPLILADGQSSLAQVATSMTDAPLPSDKAQAIARKALERVRVTERLRQQADALRGSVKIEYAKGYGPAKSPTS
ncbi:hypothetical protein [Sphingomonas xinjiangensis]|uniref:EpsD family peptidyl-prolyl cis-trans isomerase n=1 Tax=Sphingomonas xinjiangensis TaxID=643568 RepID=A0A840YJ64_9SPHN|nr:hypothetical protein [Sphingomonas xinjiangensis]MBB5712179.1 EpsD family peptidyl-prolyl cis-trans isomerase [Sphingomonas xinjiangensis]